MTAQSTLWNPSATSDVVMRAAFQAYSDLLTAVGVLKTADTGQIVISTATTPGTVPASPPTYVGYEIRKLSVAGSPDLILKFEYGIVASTANNAATYRVSIRVTAGLRSDGAGNLDSVTFVNPILQFSATTGPTSTNSTTLSRPLHMASDGANYLTVINDPAGMGTSSTTKYGYLNIALERSINATTGAYDNEAWVSVNPFNNITGAAFQVINATAGTAKSTTSTSSSVGYQIPSGAWTGSGSLTSATIMPCTVCVPTPKGPARSSLLAYSADVNLGGQYQINMYGQLVTYMACNVPYSSVMVNGFVETLYTPLLRFD